jgi:exodeoxyribonuclease V alpha subunit
MISNTSSIYASYGQAKKEIATIEPIDYFFARELFNLFPCNSTSEQETSFHLLMALSESLRAGHTCLPISAIAQSHYGYLSDDFGVVKNHGFVFPNADVINHLLTIVDLSEVANHPIVYTKNKLYMRRYFNFEQQVFGTVEQKSSTQQVNLSCSEVNFLYSDEDIKQCISDIFPHVADNLSNQQANSEIDWQKVAVANSLNKSFSVIAGGPGTGKTYTVTKLLAAMVALNQKQDSTNQLATPLKMALVAPTGKAAQRLSESLINAVNGFEGQISNEVLDGIPTETQTIHRLLGVIPHTPNFRHNENNVLNIDVLLIDEVSMVDLAMMARIFRALPSHCKVILLGDADQLPSVSAGSVLNDIAPRPFYGYSAENADYLKQITTCTVPKLTKKQANSIKLGVVDYVTFLTKSRRFDSDGGIGIIAKSVISGKYDESWSILNQSNGQNQVSHLQHDTMEWLKPLVEKYYLPLFSCQSINEAFNLLSQFRILCAMRVGDQGVEKLNELVTNILVENNIIRHEEVMYHGRPIMITENNYVQGLYNGDIGFLWKHESGHLMAVFEGGSDSYKWIMTSKLPSFVTVYAMTIHKTQGSEFNHVAMVLPNQKDNRLLSRELLYTGITRAKNKLSIATNARVWRQGVETNVKRYSGYSE